MKETVLWGTIMWSEMGKQNIHAKKSLLRTVFFSYLKINVFDLFIHLIIIGYKLRVAQSSDFSIKKNIEPCYM